MNKRDYMYNLSKFKGEKTEKCLQYYSLSHSANNNKYYTKIDNYYSDGRSRYFWSKDEWDAYQRIKQSVGDREAAERNAINKTVENNQKEKQENEKNTANKLYQYKDEIIKKTNVLLKKSR